MAGRKPTSPEARFAEKCKQAESGCVEWTGAALGNGYGYFHCGPGKRMALAHRWAYEQANGPLPVGLDCCHHCDNRRCVNVTHLFAGTRKENMEDAVRKDRMDRTHKPKGEAHGRSVLTWEKVRRMRRLWLSGSTVRELSAEFEVTTTQIHRVINNVHWKEAA
jgi:hypothetical protein